MTVRLPPLAERGSDILLLGEHFLIQTCTEYGLPPKTLAADARAALLAYRWPGNVRELANVMERTALLTEALLVTADALELPGTPGSRGAPAGTPARTAATAPMGPEQVLEALRETDWNIARAAARLKIPRSTLRYQLKRLGLTRSAVPPTGSTPLAIPSTTDSVPVARPGPARGMWPWERRQLAFLRATLVPSSDDTAPEVALALQVLVEKTESFGGRVDQRGPLGIVAAFGLDPVEDAPRRAAHAAIAIRKAAERPRPTNVERVGMKIAIHASPGLVGWTGETRVVDLDTAGRAYAVLESLVTAAETDTILVSPDAARPLERRFALVPVSLVPPPGAPGYRLEGLEQPGLAPRGAMTTFVGRGSEMEHVRHALARAAAGHGQVVALVGEPGVGKSRLVWEVTQAHGGRGWLILRASALSYGQATPYQPVIELLKGYFRIEDRDDPPQIREKVRGRLLALDPALASSADALLALLDVPSEDSPWQALGPAQRRQRILDAIKGLLLQETQGQPVLLVLEDLHWVDSETQVLLDTLVASLPTARLCLLVDYRPEYQHSWGSKTYYSQLRLDPLPPERAQELLRGLLGEGPGLERLTALLIERTEGNPFFLEEIVQTLVDSHALGGERGARYLARSVDAIEVPSTVEAVLAARIDQLPAEARRLLQVAAVIAKDVPVALLRAVAQSSEEALRQGLATLQAAELLYEARLFPDVEYTFKHALTHEVAYGSLAPQWRARLHAEIAEAIERLYPDRQAEQLDRLGHHAFRGEVWGKAAGYLHRAGVKAAEHSAYQEATTCWEQALAALAHLPENRETLTLAVDIRLDLWGRLTILGRYKAALDHLRRAEHLARVLDDRYRLGRALAGLSVALRMATGAHDQAIEAGRQAVAIATELGDPDLEVAATLRLGKAYASRGNLAAAAATLRRCVEIINRLDPSRERRLRRIDGLAALSRALFMLGHATEAMSLAEAAVREADPRDDLWSFVAATTSLGVVHLFSGDLDRAIPVLERAVATGRERSLVDWRSTAVTSLGYAYTLASRLTEGLALIEEVIEQDTPTDAISDTRNIWLRAEALFVAGRADGAEACARQVLDLARAHGELGVEPWISRLLGRIASHRDPPDVEAAEGHFRHALTLAHQLGMRPLSRIATSISVRSTTASVTTPKRTSTGRSRRPCTEKWT